MLAHRRLFDSKDHYLYANNDEDGIIRPEDVIKYDKEAPQHRKDAPAPDEEAYATDKEASQYRKDEPATDEEAYATDREAAQHRKDEPATGEDEPLQRKHGPEHDEDAIKQRNNRSVAREYQCRLRYLNREGH